MPWYHGTPDVRPLRENGFTARTEPVRCVRDRAALQAARAHANEAGISALEGHLRLSALEDQFELVPVPVPVLACQEQVRVYHLMLETDTDNREQTSDGQAIRKLDARRGVGKSRADREPGCA